MNYKIRKLCAAIKTDLQIFMKKSIKREKVFLGINNHFIKAL